MARGRALLPPRARLLPYHVPAAGFPLISQSWSALFKPLTASLYQTRFEGLVRLRQSHVRTHRRHPTASAR
jgi:hypothetical protein